MIKRRNDDHPKTKKGYIHTRIHAGCGCFLKVQKTKGNWVMTKCVRRGSSDSDSEPVKSEDNFAREDAAAAEKEFKRVFPNRE